MLTRKMDWSIASLAGLFLLSFLQISEGFESHGLELSASENIDIINGIRDLCKCQELECSCCINFFRKFKVCSSMRLVEGHTPLGNTTFTIEIDLTIKNKKVVSKSYPVENMEPLCFGMYGVALCGRLKIRRVMEDIKICGSLELRVLRIKVSEYDLYCMKIPEPKSLKASYFLLQSRPTVIFSEKRRHPNELPTKISQGSISDMIAENSVKSSQRLRALMYSSHIQKHNDRTYKYSAI